MKKPALPVYGARVLSFKNVLYGFFDFSGAKAGGANVRALGFAFNKDTLTLKIRLKNAVGRAVGVADGASRDRGFTAH